MIIFLSLAQGIMSQGRKDTINSMNAAEKLLGEDSRLTIGGYAQIDYNQPFEKGKRMNGNLDVHRLVLLFGYKFSPRIQFITEIEIEHVKEVFVEQAFLNYRVNNWLNLKGGLLLIPMGIINEYHEPPTFNGVERPAIDTYIIPTTWREIGVGVSGTVRPASMKYQLYLVNGFLSYNGQGLLNGSSGFRGGRQKGAEAISLYPNVTGKVEFYGVKGLNLGLSGYFGNSNSTLNKNVDNSAENDILQADSSMVGSAIMGFDARYNVKGLALRGQFYYARFSNTKEYNLFTGKDAGSSMIGYYLEVAYDLFSLSQKINSQLIPFIRYENYDTQFTMAGGETSDPANHRYDIVFGLSWKPVSGVAVKADYLIRGSEGSTNNSNQFNAGIGIWF